MPPSSFSELFVKAPHRRSTWSLVAAFVLITLFQYSEEIQNIAFLSHLNENIGLTRYTLERILYLFPIIWAGLLFGWRGGVITATLSLTAMLPRSILVSPNPEDAIVETIAIFVVGNLAAISLESLRRERERRSELEVAQDELKQYLRTIEENERRLAALNQTSTIISQSLELEDVLNNAISCMVDVIGAEAVRIYILDENNRKLHLAAHLGVSDEFARTMREMDVGEGFNGRVAETGAPLFVEDASEDVRLTKMIVRKENIRSQIIVPMMAKGKVAGTLAVAMHTYRQFLPEEIELLTAIANQIGVAVDNASLYQQQKQVAEQLRASEQRYRGLFENANDAIWLQDLEHNIIAANTACIRLTGYPLEELRVLKATDLISDETQETFTNIEQRIIAGQSVDFQDEVRLIKKDGSEAFIKLASSPVVANDHPIAIQVIAHDVTEEKRMRENLRLFIQEVTKAQEEERKRISQELHDEAVHALAIHSRNIDTLARTNGRLVRQKVLAQLEELRQEANQIMRGVQRLSQDLRPATLDRLGVLPAVEWLAAGTADYFGLEIDVEVLGEERRLDDEVELVLFRITQEALRNIGRHAQATQATVIVEFGDRTIRLTVTDDGKGFDAPHSVADLPRYGKLGLAGMSERAELVGGQLRILSAPGEGTTIMVELPVHE